MSLFRINTNVSALTAQRNLRRGNNLLSEAQERLSSGLRINSAADDAAGLAISQKTTTQIRGLNQASTNAQDGISMIQTAEGGLEETQSSLQRMRELAVQASNDTLTEEDRGQIQREVDALAQEIQRISDQTEFNTKNLLDGSLSADGSLGTQQLQVGANEGQTIEFNISDMGTSEEALDVAGSGETNDTVENFAGSSGVGSGAGGTYTVVEAGEGFELQNSAGTVVGSSADKAGVKFVGNGTKTSNGGIGSGAVELAAAVEADQSFDLANSSGAVDSTSTISPSIEASNSGLEAGEFDVEVTGNPASGGSVTLNNAEGDQIATLSGGTTFVSDDTGKAVLDFSDDMSANSSVAVTAFSGDETITIGGPDIQTPDEAASAITTLDNAINAVSSERSELGALQNRLETTISVDDITAENLEAARSRIRDADVAQESVKQTRGNILVQAGTSVLAQANQNPQSALQLLGG